ncbi:putative ankyrin repeat protein RF_0381 [Gigantopelta aegis]|uniref:putative ankyrin repeat protein RF_0381 n=1 Tax=Gigantopelta aegis TaxID=1735272 RepID=UPI001B88C36C|nr:putative ankyrin repeat protein RF_0381 [Gigantopelta aegis]XP_041364678.1 putative ankyrin repeat protein RF_0381 [Gigantopelta aegis]XP_041364687.1 putative ankyrin repeat protein RF_0381 [Gigantopelta aegis]XP_041364694.1 putative ankyrin repeat protein RF_0381 [Gigantopelta aegis]
MFGADNTAVSMLKWRTGSYDVVSPETDWDITAAARRGLLNQVTKCLQSLQSCSSRKLDQALNNAAMYGHAQVMEVLLEAGSDVNARDSSGSTQLFNVVLKDFPECAAVLLKHGADVNARNTFGDTAVHVACEQCRERCLGVLLSREEVDIDVQNSDGFSPLMVAAKSSFVSGVEALTRKRCNVNLVSKSHKSALIYCLGKDIPLQHDQGRKVDKILKFVCLKSLVIAKADINWPDREGFTPLHYAVKTDSLDCVRLLVNENCYLNGKGFFRQVSPQKLTTLLCCGDRATPVTAFLLSVYYGNLTITKFLVDSGCEYYNCEFVLQYLTADSDMSRYLLDVFQKVRSLQKLSIMSIRQSIGVDVRNKVGGLEIPNKLKRNICEPQMSV